MQYGSGQQRSVRLDDHPLEIQNQFLRSLGYTDSQRIQLEGLSTDLGPLFKFVTGENEKYFLLKIQNQKLTRFLTSPSLPCTHLRPRAGKETRGEGAVGVCAESEGDERTGCVEQAILRPLWCSTLHLPDLAAQGKADTGTGPHRREDDGTQEQEELLLREGGRLAERGAPGV